MFRRARLSVKPNVRPGLGARAPNPPRGPEAPRPQDPIPASPPKPAEPKDVPRADFGEVAPQEKTTKSSDEKTDGENDVEESNKSSFTVSKRRKRISSTSSLVKPSVSVPSEPHPLSTVNQEVLQPSTIPTKEKQLCSDRYRIYKAQKLREMLKEELRKEKKQWKNKYAINESQRPPDRSKMTMRDFIYYLPDNNPMTSSLEQEKKSEKLTPVQAREQEGKSTTDANDNEEIEETDDGPLLVPRVKVAEDGSIILDEESLTVEVLRTKGPCVVEENDPIFERGSTTTYSSFRKNYYSKPWSNKETDMFFLAISMVGTDFSMIGQLFPHRARIEIKNKFKREEKTNGWRIDKAFQEKRPFDFDFFAHLLQKVLAEEEKRKQKSVKNQSLKKKPSKPRKKTKVKKLASERVNDDPDESISTNISDTEISQNDAQTVEESQSLMLSGENSGQIALEPDLNQKKRRRKNQEQTDSQEVENLSGDATVQSDSFNGEKHKNECQSIRPEVNEGDYNKEQKLSCLQNIKDNVRLTSTENVEKTTDPVLSSSQQEATSVATESLESSTSDLPSSEVGTRALSEVNNVDSNCTEERTVDLKNKSLENDQTKNIKPMVRGRLQRPKPNLSRAIGKKSVLSQGKTDAENKSSHSETSGAKNHPEKDKMNTFDSFEMENTEGENTEAESISDSSRLSEKICLQEDNQPKAFRPARLMRGRLQRPQPNIGKAAERKEILASQEPIRADEKRNENDSCIDKDTPKQMEDQSCKNFDCGDITLHSEKKDSSFQNIVLDEPKTLNECLSVQENNKANPFKQVPFPRTRFQKPKPNIGRGTGRRDISSRERVPEEVFPSGEMEADLGEIASRETSPTKKVSVEANIKEMKADLNEVESRDISPKKIPKMIEVTMGVDTDLKEPGREISPREKIPEVIDATEERETDVEEMERREITTQEKASQEVKPVSEMETDLKEIGRRISPRKKIPEVIDATEEIGTDFKETGREISPRDTIPEVTDTTEERETNVEEIERREITTQEKASQEVKTVSEMETDLKETGRGISPRKKIPEVMNATEKIEADLKETGRGISPRENILGVIEAIEERETDVKEIERREITTQEKASQEVKTVSQMETDLKETGREISPRKKITVVVDATKEIETDLKEPGRQISPRETIPEVIDATEERETGIEEIERREVTTQEKASQEVKPVSEMETDLKETGRGISPGKKIPEVIDATEEIGTDFKETGREISPRETIPEVTDTTEERETNVEEIERREITTQEKASQEVKTVSEMEAKLKETGRGISPKKKMPEVIDATEEIETDLKETGRREIFPWEGGIKMVKILGDMETELEETGREISPQGKAPQELKTIGEMQTVMQETGREISLREKVLEEVSAIGKREIDLKETGKTDISLMEKVSGKTSIEEIEGDLKETEIEISLREKDSEEISATEELVADLEKTGKIDIPSRENETEESGTSRQKTEKNFMQKSSGDCSPMSSLDIKNITSEVLSVVHMSVAEKRNVKKEVSSLLKTSLQSSELGKAEDQQIRSPDDQEQQFSNINFSKSLPQEQKPFEDKPARFVRSRFKRPKPNLIRTAIKRDNMEAEKCVPGKKLGTDKMETVVMQQNSEKTNTLPSQDDVTSLKLSRAKDKSCHKEETVVIPFIQTKKNLSLSKSCDPKEESQSLQAQEKDLVASKGTQSINTFQKEMKESVIQTARPVKGRLQRPRPNIRKIEQRQKAEKSEAKDIIKEERTVLQKDDTNKKLLTVPNSQIGPEIEVVSSVVSECRIYENQSPVVLLENLPLNTNVLDGKIRHEHKPHVPSPALVIRRQFQKAKPNLGRTHSKREEPDIEKDTPYQSKTGKPEDSMLQQGYSDTQFPLKEKPELLASLEVSAKIDCVPSKESVLAKNDAQSEEPGPSGSVGEKTLAENSLSSSFEEQRLNKPTSCPQLLKESNYSRIALDRRIAISSASECELDHSERRVHRKVKPSVTRGRGSKRIRVKSSKKAPRGSKSTLVTLRASQEEEDAAAEDFESDYEDESYHLAPEEVNKAPVFVPVGLRSPEPVSAQIEETMEEDCQRRENLEITVNVPDIACIAVVEHQLSNTDVTTQEMKQENLNTLSIEMTTGEHTQDETGTCDGSTEAAIALLTMGDLALQSEINSTGQGDVGLCVLPDVESKEKSHIPPNPSNVEHEIFHECQFSSPAISTSTAPFEENKIVLEEQSTREEIGLMEKNKKNAVLTRNTASKVTNNLRLRSRFSKPKPNLKNILRTNRLGVHQKVPSLFVTKEEETEIQKETEKNTSKGTELEDKNLGSVITAESKKQSKLTCVHSISGTSISQEGSLMERNDDQGEASQEIQILSVAPIVTSETVPHTLGSGRGLSEGSIEEPPRKDDSGDSVFTLHVSEQCIPTTTPEVQQENIISPQDLTVANEHEDGEDEQAFILTLVEIPTNAVEEFTNTAAQLLPNSLLPAPILIKSVNTEERSNMSMNFPVTSVAEDPVCSSNSGGDDSEKPPLNLDLVSRKRFHCRLEESDHVPPAKKSSLTSRDDYPEYTSEVCSKELINVLEETGESYKGQDIFPTSGSTYTTPEPQKKQLKPTFQSIRTRSLDKVIGTHTEKNTLQLPQDEMIASDKEGKTGTASRSKQMDKSTSSLKTPLSRPGRRPLGFLSLICSKNSLESDEPIQVRNKKRIKPLIRVSRQNLKKSNMLNESQAKTQKSADLPQSPSIVVNTQSENTDNSETQVSCSQPLPKEGGKSGQNCCASEEQPTTVSELFFSDIFIEVDETE
ncbi:transcription factor TFIIIB component B'' homolog isoform X3 [Dasypus novemcinctus]|uniref:transcription factor TFIIIB component B'' homolog isoform X3 n=1 Tax=Dasypus novemcinctus TaxID=9361 RepID=UPI00265FC2F4|nr:transcription factor TFIIIB component B'' homolog isoform X3 [Dasypus novemcinctus]